MSGATPYSNLPDHCYWSRSHRGKKPSEIDPVVKGAFQIDKSMKIATAGSCFAQHIAKRLNREGFNYFTPESAHEVLPAAVAKAMNYGTFSARYGNLYTTRQLLQLAQRAYGEFSPAEDVWDEGDRLIDPFRPNIQPGGFATRAEYDADREQHFAAVRRIIEESDVFVFTFGLTEAWVSKEDGAVFPLCPGAAGGSFDPARHEFKNFSVDEVVADFAAFLDLMKAKNPGVKVLMTVSPVPLIATAREDQSVISSTAYSKAVLRVAAETLAQTRDEAHYFPSYEIITGAFNKGAYYEDDLREVKPRGVNHVMRLFMEHYTDADVASEADARDEAPVAAAAPEKTDVEKALDIICDEELLEKKPAAPEKKSIFFTKKPAPAVAPAARPKTQVVGLYSFPKSGNTWLRAIIAEICGIPTSGGALQKYVTDTHYGKAMENPWSFQGTDWYFYKSHHKKVLTDDAGEPMKTDKVVSIYRHPLDVFLSYLNFVSRNVSPNAGKSLPVQFDKVEDLTPEEMEMLFQIWLDHATLFPQNRKFGSIFEAAEGFRKQQRKGDPVHVIRYEDLKDDFAGTVAPMVEFLGIENADMDKVYQGADSRTQQNGKFFWKRSKKNYEKYLTEDQIARFEKKWAPELKSLGY